jgi:hypothetical protein
LPAAQADARTSGAKRSLAAMPVKR